jgi:adenylate cyclase
LYASRLRSLAAGIGGALVWVLPIAVGLVLCLESPPLVERLRNLVFDHDQQLLPRHYSPNMALRVVDIDDASLAKLGQWPWPRKRLADLAERLNGLGAAVVAFDILFSEEDRATPPNLVAQLPDIPERTALAQALNARGPMKDDSVAEALAHVPSVLALVLTNDNANAIPIKTGFAILGDNPRPFLRHFRGAVLPLESLAQKTAGLGSINWTPDRDLIVRKVPPLFAQGDGNDAPLVPSLDAEALRVAQGADTIIVKASNATGATAFGVSTGVNGVKIGAKEIAPEADGAVRVHYAGT